MDETSEVTAILGGREPASAFYRMLPTAVLSLSLVALSMLLIALHRRTARRAAETFQDPEEREFAASQYRRRMQTSAMIGLVGVLVFVGHWLDHSIGELIVWLAVVLLVVWIMLLALADIVATRAHFSRIRRGAIVEHARLQAALHHARKQQARAGNGNGKP
ncbi:MAG: hypothetical protein WD468_02145 [Pirellulales bacterium]